MALFGQQHVDRYVATDGEEGYDWNGAHTLILTTTGRRSGRQRQTPLIFGRHGDDYLIVASMGGSPENPAWYFNLVDNPEVGVQVKGETFRANARTATPAERAELWPIMTTEWPAYDGYQVKTDREIPVVVLEPR